ncbi:MAG TPA: hypothetical protein VKQ36_09345 [Ktedonobacterales bacterium]|nr:hypothetical protein [Ktedonobacterales bacterium]
MKRKLVVMHVEGEQPFKAELIDEPDPSMPFVHVFNPLTLEGRTPEWVTKGTINYYFSWSSIKFIEVYPENSGEEVYPFDRDRL